MSSPFDKALSTLSSTAHSILDIPVHRHAFPIFTAAALSMLAFSYLLPSNFPRSKETTSYPLIKRAPRGSKEDDLYHEDFFDGAHYVDTPYGQVKVYETGPTNGMKVILVHGITTPTPVFKEVVEKLVQAGFRVMLYDLYGRGRSDSVQMPHDVPLFIAQLAFVLAAKPDWTKFSVAGMSFGGPIVATFAHYFPERIEKIFLICPVGGTPANKADFKTRLFRSLPSSLLKPFIFLSPVQVSKDVKSIVYWQAKNHPGFYHSFLSSVKYGAIFDQADTMNKVCKEFGGRIECVWGDEDDAVEMETKEYFAGDMKIHVIPGGGHMIVSSHSDRVAELLIAHLNS